MAILVNIFSSLILLEMSHVNSEDTEGKRIL